MDDEGKVVEVVPWRRLGFWNRFAMITLAYGALMVLLEVEYQRAIGGLEFLDRLDGLGLMTLIVMSGSFATQALRSRCFIRDEWHTLQRATLALTGILGALSSARGDWKLALTAILAAGIHVVMPAFMKD